MKKLMNFPRFLSMLLPGLLLSWSAWGQSTPWISQPVDNGGIMGAMAVGQSFVAPTTTLIQSIGVRPSSAGSFNLFVYNGSSGSGTSGVGTPAYSQSAIALAAATSNGAFQNMALSTPFPVTAGQSYTFVLENADPSSFVGLFAAFPEVYAGGTAIVNFGTVSNTVDLAFQITEATASNATAVPTLSEWGLLLLTLTIAGGAVVGWRRGFH
ncbi:IPTL-CTERM sorting domain-containing protein [Alicycliphilus denitrificans]|uniref:IPTL-CTERM sorting domain-containing protein n=1 Tax=Alicycliphilus denitrificans TaxID=179636 RepID=UPI001AD5C374|nr:IPTL-CTERM sorting domain-containing protein [Alicycliphilus denitrificans]MBN9576155.1 IPTL-CTERM sorting domain-containing protein [Alicycliphilus denitrificans]